MTTPILTRADVEAHVTATRTVLLRMGVQRLALFGSVQRNEARGDSDVDVLVEFAPGQKTFDHLLALARAVGSEVRPSGGTGHSRILFTLSESIHPQ